MLSSEFPFITTSTGIVPTSCSPTSSLIVTSTAVFPNTLVSGSVIVVSLMSRFIMLTLVVNVFAL